MTHAPPLEDCWCSDWVTVCQTTPHIDPESETEWQNRHARLVAQEMQVNPENC